MGTHADYVAAVAQSCTSLYTRLATHRPVVALRTHLQPRMHDLTSTSRAVGNIVVKLRHALRLLRLSVPLSAVALHDLTSTSRRYK